MLCLLVSCLLPVKADLGIAFTVSDASHCQVHADLGALALEVCAQAADDLLADAFGNVCAEALADADYMLSCPGLLLGLLDELAAGDIADGALLRGSVAFVNVTTYGAYPFCHNNLPPKIINTLYALILIMNDVFRLSVFIIIGLKARNCSIRYTLRMFFEISQSASAASVSQSVLRARSASDSMPTSCPFLHTGSLRICASAISRAASPI